jgi:hypothetical protein
MMPRTKSRDSAQIPRYDVVVPFWEDCFQRLHEVYCTNILFLLKEQLERGGTAASGPLE